MLKRFSSILLLLLPSCSEGGAQSGEVASGLPPVRFRGDATFSVVATSDVERDCKVAGLKPVAETKTEACAIIGGKAPVVITPNPCKATGAYARTLCHELGHVNGWPSTHGE